jgi:hypothetical protein
MLVRERVLVGTFDSIDSFGETTRMHQRGERLSLAAREPERVKLVNGRVGIDEIEREVWSIVSQYV